MSTIIRSIAFHNFYNYYGDYKQNTYNFSEGLNIINADNGMGKSKLFNGILWILKNHIYDSDTQTEQSITSAPLKILSVKAKLEDNNTCKTGVKLTFDVHDTRYTVEKYITFTKKKKKASISNPEDWNISGVLVDVAKDDLVNGDHDPIYDTDAQDDIIKNLIINPIMQPYALLQGEAIDNIVDLSDSTKLSATIETLTDLSELKTIEKTCNNLLRYAKTDLEKKQNETTRNSEQYEDCRAKKQEAEDAVNKFEEEIRIYKEEIQKASETQKEMESKIANTEKRVQYKEKLNTLNDRLEREKVAYAKKLADINNNLFIRQHPWLLLNTAGFIDRFTNKRDLYMKERYRKALLAKPELILTDLPEGSPDDLSLSKMLERCECFVCGHKFAEGSPEYNRILQLRNRSIKEEEDQDVDLHSFFDRIQGNIAQYANIDGIYASIANERVNVNTLRAAIIQTKKEISDTLNEYCNYGGSKAENEAEADLNFTNRYKAAIESLDRNKGLIEKTKELIKRKKKDIEIYEIKMEEMSGSDVPHAFIEIKQTLEDTKTIFENTKKRIYDEVISKLESRSNEFYNLLTAGNNVLGGTMKFEKTDFDSIYVKVVTETGEELSGASEGFQRMKKIAVVMAIIASNIGNGKFSYPFIADAPFSAFGKNFIKNFFNTVPNVFTQSIIMIKDLYDIDDSKYLTEEGHKIWDKMKSGEIKGTFYVNYIEEPSDPTKLITNIKCYKKPDYECK